MLVLILRVQVIYTLEVRTWKTITWSKREKLKISRKHNWQHCSERLANQRFPIGKTVAALHKWMMRLRFPRYLKLMCAFYLETKYKFLIQLKRFVLSIKHSWIACMNEVTQRYKGEGENDEISSFYMECISSRWSKRRSDFGFRKRRKKQNYKNQVN